MSNVTNMKPVDGCACNRPNVLVDALANCQDKVVSVNYRERHGGWLIVTESGKLFVIERAGPDDDHVSLSAVEVRMKT